MKKFRLIIFLMTASVFCFGQTLQQGIYSTVILGIDSFPGHPWANGCWDYEYEFAGNCLPYVTGMDLCLKIDTIKGSSDSIQVWRWPDLISIYLKSNDTIPLTNNLGAIYFYYLDYDTLYTSLIAYGTPQIAGENYFCHFSKSHQVWIDGCGNLYAWVTGGNGAMDTLKGCPVLSATGMNEVEEEHFEIYPNPVNDNLTLNLADNISKTEIKIYNLLGEIEIFFLAKIGKNIIDVRNLSDGIYILEISPGNKLARQKFIKQCNSR